MVFLLTIIVHLLGSPVTPERKSKTKIVTKADVQRLCRSSTPPRRTALLHSSRCVETWKFARFDIRIFIKRSIALVRMDASTILSASSALHHTGPPRKPRTWRQQRRARQPRHTGYSGDERRIWLEGREGSPRREWSPRTTGHSFVCGQQERNRVSVPCGATGTQGHGRHAWRTGRVGRYRAKRGARTRGTAWAKLFPRRRNLL